MPHTKHTYGSPRPVTELALLFYVDDIRTSQETHVWASTACYGDSFNFLYVDDVCTSQETRLWSSTACHGDSFTSIFGIRPEILERKLCSTTQNVYQWHEVNVRLCENMGRSLRGGRCALMESRAHKVPDEMHIKHLQMAGYAKKEAVLYNFRFYE
jgi:hypothetical protein